MPRRSLKDELVDKAIAYPKLNYINLNDPVIITEHDYDPDNNHPELCLTAEILIDGAHRIRLAYLQKRRTLPCWYIPEDINRSLVSEL